MKLPFGKKSPPSTGALAQPRSRGAQALDIGKTVVREFGRDDMSTIAAGIAYHTLFAIPPLLVFVVAMAAAVNQFSSVPVADTLRDSIRDSAPQQSQQLLIDMVDGALEQVSGGAATIGGLFAIALALWSGSNAFGVISRSFNRAYFVEESRGFLVLKAQSVFMTVLLGTLAIVAAGLLVSGGETGGWIADQLGLSSVFEVVWQFSRIPLALLFLIVMLTALYWFAPAVKHPLKFVLPGALLATVMFGLISFGIRIYLQLVDPGSAYGAASGIVILLLFAYFISMALTLGAELNAVLWRRYATPEMATAAARTLSGPKPRPTASPPTIAPPEPYSGGQQASANLTARQGEKANRNDSSNRTGDGDRLPDDGHSDRRRYVNADVAPESGASKPLKLAATAVALLGWVGVAIMRFRKIGKKDRKAGERDGKLDPKTR